MGPLNSRPGKAATTEKDDTIMQTTLETISPQNFKPFGHSPP